MMDDIVVKPPYKVEDCSGGTEVALERVRMMVGQINARPDALFHRELGGPAASV